MKPMILIVDDEPHVTSVLSMKLGKAGYDVRTASNGVEALDAIARDGRPGLIVTDCQMPRMDGLELCARLHADQDTRQIPRIMLTSRGFEITDEQREQRGIVRLLSKPFSPKELLEVVREYLAPDAQADDTAPAAAPGAAETSGLAGTPGATEATGRTEQVPLTRPAPAGNPDAPSAPGGAGGKSAGSDRPGGPTGVDGAAGDPGAALAQARREIESLTGQLTATYEELALVYEVSARMQVNQGPAAFLADLAGQVRETIAVEAIAAMLYPRDPAGAEQVVLVGDLEMSDEQLRLLATELIGRAPLADEHKPLIDNDLCLDAALGLGRKVRRVLAAPMDSGGQSHGLLLALNKPGGEFDTIEAKLLSSVAGQAAVFLANQALFADMQQLLMGSLHALTAAIDAKDAYTRGHSERVARVGKLLAEQIGLPDDQVQRIYLSGLLHDVGKIGMPESILCKNGRLTDEEFAVTQQHPATGGKILGGIRQLEDVLVGVVAHHERYDGRGYPEGLAGEEIPLVGRILALADTFDAMTSSRTYRKALPLEVVREEVAKCAGSQFDPDLAEAFLQLDLQAVLDELHDPDRVAWTMPDLILPGCAPPRRPEPPTPTAEPPTGGEFTRPQSIRSAP